MPKAQPKAERFSQHLCKSPILTPPKPLLAPYKLNNPLHLLLFAGLPPTSTPNMSCYYVCCSPSYRTVRTTRRTYSYCRPCYTSCCSPCYTSCYRSCCSPRYISCCSPCYTSYCSPCSYRRCYTRYYYPSYCTYSSGCCYC